MIHKKNISETIPNQSKSENIDNEKLINNVNIPNKIENQSKKESSDHVEFVTQANISKNIQKNNESGELKEKWELILSKLELPSTKMLLSQQAELVSIDSSEIEIALSPNWENMIKSRKVIIENTVKKIFGKQIKLNFSRKELHTSNLSKSQEKINESQPKKRTQELGKVDDFDTDDLDKLYKIIALGALKYFLLKVDPKKKMLFNPDESIDFNGNTGPFRKYLMKQITRRLVNHLRY